MGMIEGQRSIGIGIAIHTSYSFACARSSPVTRSEDKRFLVAGEPEKVSYWRRLVTR